MTRAVAVIIFALLSWGLLTFTPTGSEAMPPEWRKSFVTNLKDIHARQPFYRMDPKIKPDDPLEAGVDCSRLPYLALVKAARRSGFQVQRVPSLDMAHGLGGWVGYDLTDKLRDSDETDLAFWTFEPLRPFGHVGIFLVGPKSGLLEVLHASSSRRTTVIQPLLGSLERDLVKVRRLTIGDK